MKGIPEGQEAKIIEMHPVVSVLMPAYNCDQYVSHAITGILGQSYKNFEFIIINDGSTDSTRNEILAFKDFRIRYHEHEANMGLVATLNNGLDLCQGKYIMRADADDFAFPNMMKDFVEFMECNPDHVVCGANIKVKYPGRMITFKYPSEHSKLLVYALDGCPFSSHTFIRKSVLFAHNLAYKDHYYPGEDHGLWSEIVQFGKLHNLKKVSSIYNKSNSDSTTASAAYKVSYPVARRNIFEYHAKAYFMLNDLETKLYIKLHACSDRYLKVIMSGVLGNIDELLEIRDLLSKILHENNIRRFFDQRLLKRFLLQKWTYACYHARFFGIRIWPVYFEGVRRIILL